MQPWEGHIVDIIHQFTGKTVVKDLTCCGLQKKQGEETADQVCTLHDGCQENSDCHTGYIYQGRKVKGHVERGGRAQRGPASGGAGVCVLCAAGVMAYHRDTTRTGSWCSFETNWQCSAGDLQDCKTWISVLILPVSHCLSFDKICFKYWKSAMPQCEALPLR